MNRLSNCGTLVAMGLLAAASLFATAPACAATYTVDTVASSITLSASVGGTPLTPQAAGADVDFFGGTVEATVPLGGGLLTLGSSGGFGTSDIIGLPNSAAPFLPTIGGGPLAVGDDEVGVGGVFDPSGTGDGIFTSGTENYGMDLSGLFFAAIRDLRVTAEGSGMTGVAATGIGWNISNGWAAFDALGLGESWLGQDATDPAEVNDPGVGSLGYSLIGLTEKITLPIDVTIVDGSNSFGLIGSIVAVRTIPEPSGLFLAAIGGLSFCAWIARRKRNHIVEN